MDMENNDKIKGLVFKYLDGLFENIEIQENEFGMRGEIGNTLLFTYLPNYIFVSRNTIRFIMNMFGIGEYTSYEYVKEYLSKKVSSSFGDADISATL